MARSTLEQVNSKTYTDAATRQLYTYEKWLPSEASLLLDYRSDIVEKKILELGAGSGRIASVLKNRADVYYATDVNPDMIKTLRNVHPGVRAEIADARTLSQFGESEFDTVIFSFNGIDCIAFEERSGALSEINRVLKPGGAFIHSTHNVAHARSASHEPSLRNSGNSPLDYAIRKLNRWRLVRYEKYYIEYAIVNDRALRNGLLNVYIKPEIHLSQLNNAGFDVDAIYERDGRRLHPGESPADQWFYLVARKRREKKCSLLVISHISCLGFLT